MKEDGNAIAEGVRRLQASARHSSPPAVFFRRFAPQGVGQRALPAPRLLAASSIGEFDMYLLEPPVIPDIPAFVVTAKADAQIKSDVRAIGFCHVAGYTASEGEPENGQAGIMFDVGYAVRQYFYDYENRRIEFGSVSREAVQLIKGPSHGKISYDGPDHWEYAVVYKPDQGYVGTDYVEFLVDLQRTPVRVVYFIKETLNK
jgi:hypothetical protein